jgi:predicted nucleotidyltransferase
MLQNCNILNVARVFFLEPTIKHYLKEISSKSNLSHTSVKIILNKLKKENIVLENPERKGKRTFPYFISNIDSNNYKFYKQISNFLDLQNSGLIDLLEKELMPKSIVLFGSYFRGEDVEDSDIDLFVESKRREMDLGKFENILKRKIQLHFSEKFKDYPPELKNSIINGIVLEGYLK